MKKKKIAVGEWWWVFVLVGFLAVFAVIIFIVNNTEFEDRGLPIINIELNGVSLEEINGGDKDIKYSSNRLAIREGGITREYDDIVVKGRGNGTWTQEKKPYQIKFNEKVDLFGLGKAKKWVLLANAMDATNLRTAAAFRLEEMLDMKYRFSGEFVELYINNRYEGLYYLTHAVEVGKNVVDLKDSMGILVELDNLYYEWERYYKTGNGDYLLVKDVVDEMNEEEAMRRFLKAYDEFERAVAEKNYERVKELVDIESFAQYYLLSEFLVNPDAYWTSFYMYKDGDSDKIHAGPGWDFDLAFANRRWINWMGQNFYSPEATMIRKGELLTMEEYEQMDFEDKMDCYNWSMQLSRIVFDMMELPEFQEDVADVYKKRMRGNIKELGINILEWARSIERPMWEDYKKWNRGDYGSEIEEMVKWIRRRSEYFEQEYGQGESSLVNFL